MCRNYDAQLCKLQKERKELQTAHADTEEQLDKVVAGLQTAQQNLEKKVGLYHHSRVCLFTLVSFFLFSPVP